MCEKRTQVLVLLFLLFSNSDAQFLLLSRAFENDNNKWSTNKTKTHTNTYTLLVCLPYLAFTLSLSLSLFRLIFLLSGPQWDDVSFWNANCSYIQTNTHVYVRNCSACVSYVVRVCVCQCEYVHNWFCYGSVANRLISGPLRIEICTALSAILFQNLHLSIKTDA